MFYTVVNSGRIIVNRAVTNDGVKAVRRAGKMEY